ncbi:MAG: phenazine biosynthesis protein PhzF [Maribacter sp.]|nr:MAG: phenazine biosynthesis protein PhzF [Maribacter sp.]
MKLYQVDSFTNEIFKGNPAGVCIVDSFPEIELMQNIAMEMNLSETAFVEILNGNYNIRYFTPTMEVPLCGHATLASAHILYELGIIGKAVNFTFKAKEADLKISLHDSWIKMNFPTYSVYNTPIPKELNQVLGVNAIEIHKSDNNWTIVLLDSENEIRNAAPDFEKLRFGKYGKLIAVTSKSDNSDYDFVVRVFCDPESGIREDPVTGAANCILVPFWNLKTNLKKFKSKQLSSRTGEIMTELIEDKVNILGQAKTVMSINLRE